MISWKGMTTRRWLSVLPLLGVTATAGGATQTWISAGTGFFHDGTNWSLGAAPGSLDQAWFTQNTAPTVVWNATTGNPINAHLYVKGPSDTTFVSSSAPDTFNYSLNGAGGVEGTILIEFDGRLTVGSTTLTNPELAVIAQREIDVRSGGTLVVTQGGTVNETGGVLDDGTSIGDGSDGSLLVEAGGVLNSTSATIAGGLGASTSDATVTGTGSQWVVPGVIDMGRSLGSTATLDILDSGTVTTNGVTLAWSTTSTATLTLDGVGSVLDARNVSIGSSGNGTMLVRNQASFQQTSGPTVLGSQPTGIGVLEVTGNGTTWTKSGSIAVGLFGSGTLSITDGATASSTTFGSPGESTIGSEPGSTGLVTVSDTGSSLTLEEDMSVGFEGDGTLEVLSNATVSNQDSFIAELPGSTGLAVVDGDGSIWETNGAMHIGGDGSAAGGSGVLTVSGDGLATVSGPLRIWDQGRLNIYGGRVDTSELIAEPGAQIDFRHGTLAINNDVTIQPGDALELALGSTRDLTFGKTLLITGQATLNDVITLDGGTLTTQGFVNPDLFDFKTGTLLLLDFAGQTIGAGGQFGEVGLVKDDQYVFTFGDLTIDAGASLTMEQGGTFQADQFHNSGLVHGSGTMIGGVNNLTGGEIAVNTGDLLVIDGDGNTSTNAGQVSLAGGQLRLPLDFTNQASGLVIGNGTLRADGGIANDGDMAFTATANIVGDVINTINGLITSSGGTLTFFDDVINNGTIRTNANSFTVYLGSYSGSGDAGTGTVIMEGDLKPGSSPGVMAFGGSLVFGGASTLAIELGGTTPNTEHDTLLVFGDATLGGTLDLSLINGFTPMPYDTFNVIETNGLTGRFDQVTGVGIGGGQGLAVTYDAFKVVVTAALLGDTDLDGDVDDADLGTSFSQYTGPVGAAGGKTWADGDTDGDGDVDDADLGNSFAGYTGPLGPNNVPEPTTCAVLGLGVLLTLRRTRCV